MIIADVDLELLRGKEYEFHEWLDRKLTQVRAEALEEAAKVADQCKTRMDAGAEHIAVAIRGLK